MCALFCFSLFFWQCSVYTGLMICSKVAKKKKSRVANLVLLQLEALWGRRYYVKLISSDFLDSWHQALQTAELLVEEAQQRFVAVCVL